jgi:hypothetical protein
MDLGSIEMETHDKVFIEWVMPYPDFLPVILNMFLGQISECFSIRYYGIISYVFEEGEGVPDIKEN